MTEIKNVADIFDGTHQTPEYKDCGIPFVSVENIDDIYNYNKFISIDAYTKEFSKNHPEQNDILMTRIGDIGTPAFVTRSKDMGYYVSLALLKPKNINNKYLYYYIQTSYFQHELWKKTIHVAFPKKINKEDIGDCEIFLPNLTFQDQIVELFDKLEARIIAQKKIIEDKILLKKQINIKCFNSLKNNTNISLLKELCIITTGKLDANAMNDSGKYRFYTCAENYYYIDSYAFDGESLLISGNGANVGYIHYYDGKFNAYQRTYVLQNFKIMPKYIKCFLDLYLKKRISNQKNTGNTPYIKLDTLSEMKIVNPPLEIQNNIIKINDAINEIIDNEKRILSDYQKQKEFLLNHLFI